VKKHPNASIDAASPRSATINPDKMETPLECSSIIGHQAPCVHRSRPFLLQSRYF